jgi:hypothetical protein
LNARTAAVHLSIPHLACISKLLLHVSVVSVVSVRMQMQMQMQLEEVGSPESYHVVPPISSPVGVITVARARRRGQN